MNPRRNLLTSLCSHGLVKTYGPDDMRTELKDVSVFRMDVHMPEAPQARLQATLRTYCGLECPIIRSPVVRRCPHTSTGRLDTFFYRQKKQPTRFFIASPGSCRHLSQLNKDPILRPCRISRRIVLPNPCVEIPGAFEDARRERPSRTQFCIDVCFDPDLTSGNRARGAIFQTSRVHHENDE